MSPWQLSLYNRSMAKILAAVSGGVDSAVLLNLLSKTSHEVIVAHVDHGIREESDEDARFVEALATRYGYLFVATKLSLGEDASEHRARQERYAFLRAEAMKHQAVILTAHHADDLIETIAINLTRGTGWRGLAVFGNTNIHRPLVAYRKAELYDYALAHHLEWVEDRTNRDQRYLRNKLRARLATMGEAIDREKLAELWEQQRALKQEIDREDQILLEESRMRRHFFTQLDDATAKELLAAAIVRAGGVRPTWPQVERAVIALKTAKAGTTSEVAAGVRITFTSRHFSVEVIS